MKAIHSKDYKKLDFFIDEVYLNIDLYEDYADVRSEMLLGQHDSKTDCIELNGENLEFQSILVNNEKIERDRYSVEKDKLTLSGVKAGDRVEIRNRIYPQNNTLLEGLYKSSGIFCTQNEPEGFRGITYFIDRPDNMSLYKTRITADKSKYPHLLSNGNPIESGIIEEDRHYVVWEDPFRKPSYLFALVAGDLALVEDSYKTKSGRDVALRFFVDKGNENQCAHAIDSLKNAMKWDEDVYGLEYDLDIYMIVAVDSFNMGAMENKGLNVFNSAYVLARPESATDSDYEGVEGVIGHEYFHNWTGNRVTCRDWFQLTLKEGLTVYRDQNFSRDMGEGVLKRISDVWGLRSAQFPEDSGPNAHPIKPDSYIEINNFYTATVYSKGAEVIRMLTSIVGEDVFRKGITKYFELYDGMAVTTEDFIHAMEKASGHDLAQFKRWYSQRGTPRIKVDKSIESNQTVVNITQIETTLGERIDALYFPLDIALYCAESGEQLYQELVTIKDEAHRFELPVTKDAYLSVNRNFSAPIIVEYDYQEQELVNLIKYESDGFQKWDLFSELVVSYFRSKVEGGTPKSSSIVEVVESLLDLSNDQAKFVANMLSIPGINILSDALGFFDYPALSMWRKELIAEIAMKLTSKIESRYASLPVHKIENDLFDRDGVGVRALRTSLLYLINVANKGQGEKMVFEAYLSAGNMTESISALSILVQKQSDLAQKALADFYNKWQGNFLVMNKWIAVQASRLADENVFKRLEDIEGMDLFDIKNPNRTRSLYAYFARGNLEFFHHRSGKGYEFIAERIMKLDEINPRIASSLAGAFQRYARLPQENKSMMKIELEKILGLKKLSKDTYEIVSKTLEQGKS